jgi:SAM-dependent methyltransferase
MPTDPASHDHAYELNRLNWDERVDSHFNSPMYQQHVRDLRAGSHCIDPEHVQHVGDVTGKRLIHLQCHMGMETLSWARLGATVTGIDFSQPAIDRANQLAAELDIPATFIRTNVYDTLDHVPAHSFDIAFVSVGAIIWLPDIDRWASVVAATLEPGGTLYMEENHPFTDTLGDHATEPILYVRNPYFHTEGIAEEYDGTYTDLNARFRHNKTVTWIHPIGSVINALINHGLTIRALHEQARCVWPKFLMMREVNPNLFEMPEPLTGKLPMMYTLIADKR